MKYYHTIIIKRHTQCLLRNNDASTSVQFPSSFARCFYIGCALEDNNAEKIRKKIRRNRGAAGLGRRIRQKREGIRGRSWSDRQKVRQAHRGEGQGMERLLVLSFRLYQAYTNYLEKRYPGTHWAFSPIVAGIGAIIVIWISVLLIDLINDFANSGLIASVSGFLRENILGIFVLILVFGYALKIIARFFWRDDGYESDCCV